MFDSLLYASKVLTVYHNSPSANLQNGMNEETVAHIERVLELNALKESDDLPIATMASASTSCSTCCPMASTPIRKPNALTVMQMVIPLKTV